jgi:3-oxoacid CoA-transferase subunit A
MHALLEKSRRGGRTLPAGSLEPNEIHIPGIMVQRIFQGEKFEKE